MHGEVSIRLGSLKRWLPMNHPDLLEIASEAILPEIDSMTNDILSDIKSVDTEKTWSKDSF